ncbi:MAG: adenosylcobinamide-GDP ribazoletransferase [Kiritimatiellia bacterium]|nr:adenosylcobinamide-GDP ribazoletransferase [Kiritimatiellia bacterium]
MVRSFITAIRTLTILPVPGREAERPADSLYFFPLVGIIIGGLVQLVVWSLAAKLNWTGGAALAGVLVLVWLTRALHLDGLSDTVDACLASPERERRLAIMKDPHVGAFGAAAIFLALLCKITVLERLAATQHLAWIAVPVILSRTVMVLVAVSLPYARPAGGKAQAFFSGSRKAHFWVAGTLALILCLLLAGWIGAFAVMLALMLGLLAVWWMKKTFGGATGDLLGFTGEVTECILYFSLASISMIL